MLQGIEFSGGKHEDNKLAAIFSLSTEASGKPKMLCYKGISTDLNKVNAKAVVQVAPY